MGHGDDRLGAIWSRRKRQPSHPSLDEMMLASWIDAGCPEDEVIETLLSDDPRARAMLSSIRLAEPVEQTTPAPELLETLRSSIMEHLSDVRDTPQPRTVIGSIGLTTSAAAAAIVVAALGFIFGQAAAPATNEATNNFVAAVTFDLLEADSSELESIILATGLTPSESRKGDEQ
ncbi:MAG: hypothetical protein CMJ40_02310 [Phycisphaerae bacterium]|nr:hypothetical protein [Phycisphaerae bacterium]